MKAKYFGKEIELDDDVIPGRDEFDNNDYDLLLEKTQEIVIIDDSTNKIDSVDDYE